MAAKSVKSTKSVETVVTKSFVGIVKGFQVQEDGSTKVYFRTVSANNPTKPIMFSGILKEFMYLKGYIVSKCKVTVTVEVHTVNDKNTYYISNILSESEAEDLAILLGGKTNA